jgi:hypothetical protein
MAAVCSRPRPVGPWSRRPRTTILGAEGRSGERGQMRIEIKPWLVLLSPSLRRLLGGLRVADWGSRGWGSSGLLVGTRRRGERQSEVQHGQDGQDPHKLCTGCLTGLQRHDPLTRYPSTTPELRLGPVVLAPRCTHDRAQVSHRSNLSHPAPFFLAATLRPGTGSMSPSGDIPISHRTATYDVVKVLRCADGQRTLTY